MKTYYIKLFSFLFILIFDSASSQIGYSPKVDSLVSLISIPSVSIIDRQLSGDTSCIIGGSDYTIVSRYYGSTSNSKAAQFILEKFQSYGLSARYMTNSATDVNVIAVKPGTKYPNQYFIICSHYDDMPSGTIAPGADDNASGTVGVLEAARVLSNYNLDYTIVFATFDEEERGLYGSKAYSDSAYLHGDSIVGVINLDMIAYDGNNDGKSYMITNTNSSSLADDFISTSKIYVPVLNPLKIFDNTANSDHASFWTHNYKAILSIEDEDDFTPYYHKVTDKFNTLNLPFFSNMTKAAIATLTSLAGDYKMQIIHTPIASGPNTANRIATVVIKSNHKIANSTNAPRLYYRINSGSFNFVNFSYNNLDTFEFVIPGQSIGTNVSYYIAAQDSLSKFICTLPSGGKGIDPPGTVVPPTLFTYQVADINSVCVGTGSNSSNYPFTTNSYDGRTDMLFTASEITSAGGLPGLITKIGFDVLTADAIAMNGFNIKMQNTNLATLSGFTNTGWTVVYSGTYAVPGTGVQYITFNTPYLWNGTSNLLIEVCYNNASHSQYSTVKSTAVSGMTYGRYQDLTSGDGCVDITTGSVISYRPNVCFFSLIDEINNFPGNQPVKYSLSQNFPNPFNPVTKINYSIPKSGFVLLKVFDILGREIANLVSENKTSGYYSIDFNASDLTSGVYFYKLTSGTYSEVKKMTVIK
jgi:hypothetical protein